MMRSLLMGARGVGRPFTFIFELKRECKIRGFKGKGVSKVKSVDADRFSFKQEDLAFYDT